MLPIYKNITINYDNNLVEHIFPDPSQIKILFKNEILKFKIIFKSDPLK